MVSVVRVFIVSVVAFEVSRWVRSVAKSVFIEVSVISRWLCRFWICSFKVNFWLFVRISMVLSAIFSAVVVVKLMFVGL